MRKLQSGGCCYLPNTATFLALVALHLQFSSCQQIGRMMHGVSMKRSHSHMSSQHLPELLALWIDGRQVEKFTGHSADMYLIKGGVVSSYLQEPFIMSKLPTMPHDMDLIQLTWKAEKETFRYKFSDLRSLNPDILYNPLLSIPTSGDVPKHQSVFELTIACTRNRSGVATMSIALNIYNSKYEQINGSPLDFHLKKKCEAADKSRSSCKFMCRNGGRCGEMKKCECKPGYSGQKCEIDLCQCENGGTCLDRDRCKCPPGYYGDKCQSRTGMCEVPCKNRGICTANNLCSCPDGYTGNICQRPSCNKVCGVNGRCVDVNKCKCYRGWRGKECNKTDKVSVNDQDNDGTASRRRKRRKLRQSEVYRMEPRKRPLKPTFPPYEVEKKKKNKNKQQNKIRRNKNDKNILKVTRKKFEEEIVDQ